MSVVLSTINNGQITASQARALHQSVSQSRDVVIASHGLSLLTPTPIYTTKLIDGIQKPIFRAQVGTGILISDGVILENTTTYDVDFVVPATGGVMVLVSSIDLSTGLGTFKFKDLASVTRNDLVNMQTGIREVPLYYATYTTTAITSWQDWRPIANNSGTPAGAIMEFAGLTPPKGYLICDGSYKHRSQYPELFAAIGTFYGTTDSTNFKLPDKKGRVSVGLDTTQQEFNVLGKIDGAKTHVLTGDELPTHRVFTNGADAPFYENVLPANSLLQSGSTFGVALPKIGKNTPHNNLQPYIVTNFIIKY